MGIGMIPGKDKNRCFSLGSDCQHENCVKPKLSGRKFCFDHQLEAEEKEDREGQVDSKFAPDWYYESPLFKVRYISPVEIYFIAVEGEEMEAVKIGRTAGDVDKRLRALQIGNHKKLVVLATAELPQSFETKMHRALKKSRIRGEWFKREGLVNDLIEAARAGADKKSFQKLLK